jgi:DNA-directed RNA polymerase sigma subunit (sigma70/sigma32)
MPASRLEAIDNALEDAFVQLHPEHQDVLMLRYGLHGWPEMSVETVASALSIPTCTVERIERQALKRLRHDEPSMRLCALLRVRFVPLRHIDWPLASSILDPSWSPLQNSA